MEGLGRNTVTATLGAVVAVMPVFLLGASGFLVQRDLGFGPSGLGTAVAAYMGVSALFGVPAGALAQRIGARVALRGSTLLSGAIMVATGTLVTSLRDVVLLLGLAGLCNGVAQPASNLALADGATTRPALLFGVKQSATPLATLLAGASVPAVGVTVGWRWTFVLAGLMAITASLLVPTQSTAGRPSRLARTGGQPSSTWTVLGLALTMGLGTGAAVALAAFLVDTAVGRGMSPSAAGSVLVAGSVAGVLVRLTSGWNANRVAPALTATATLLVVGAAGYALLAVDLPVAFVVGAVLAYGGGWGWPGLLFFAVVELRPDAPATASGVVAAVGSAGATLGPLALGQLIAATSYNVAWMVAAMVALVAAVLVVVIRAHPGQAAEPHSA